MMIVCIHVLFSICWLAAISLTAAAFHPPTVPRRHSRSVTATGKMLPGCHWKKQPLPLPTAFSPLQLSMASSGNTNERRNSGDSSSNISSMKGPTADKEEEEPSFMVAVGDSHLDCEATEASSEMHSALRKRLESIETGIGKRYVCRTQKGFLNVHQEPGDPYCVDNIVGQLKEGQIVTSTGPHRGPWVKHDGGGWSISIFGGFKWLEELQE